MFIYCNDYYTIFITMFIYYPTLTNNNRSYRRGGRGAALHPCILSFVKQNNKLPWISLSLSIYLSLYLSLYIHIYIYIYT